MSVYRNILVALDGSADSRTALRHAVTLAGDQHAKLTLLTVVPHPATPVGPGVAAPRVDRQLPGAGGLVNRMLDPATRSSLDADMLARLGDAVGLAAHEAFIASLAIAALTLMATLCLPARLSPTRTPV